MLKFYSSTIPVPFEPSLTAIVGRGKDLLSQFEPTRLDQWLTRCWGSQSGLH